MRCFPSSIFDFGPTSQFDWPITQKTKIWRLQKIEDIILKYKIPPLWPTYIAERKTRFAKTYGIKVRCYGEHVEEHNGNLKNLMKSHWKLERNIVKTHWEPRKNEKKSFPPELKKKKARHLECMLGPSHWLHEISPPKRVWHHFWPQLLALAKNTLFINWGYFFFVGTYPHKGWGLSH